MKKTAEVYQDRAGEFRWRLKVGQKIVADGGEGYKTRASATRAIRNVLGFTLESIELVQLKPTKSKTAAV